MSASLDTEVGLLKQFQFNDDGTLKTDAAVTTGDITIGTANQGTANTATNGWPVKMTDGTNTLGTVSHPLYTQEGDGANVALGATTDTAVTSDASGTTTGFLRGLVKWAYSRMPASLGQKVMTGSLPVVIASNQSAVATADGALNTVAGQTTDNAITSDSDGTLAGFLRGLVKWAFTAMPAALDQTTMAGSLPVVIASDQSKLLTANAGLTPKGTHRTVADCSTIQSPTQAGGLVIVLQCFDQDIRLTNDGATAPVAGATGFTQSPSEGKVPYPVDGGGIKFIAEVAGATAQYQFYG